MDYMNERKQVMDAVREICSAHLVTGTWGNVSARIGDQPLMLVTPSGMEYSTMEPEDLVLVDFNKRVVAGQYKPSVETLMHLKIYQRRPDVMAIIHEHGMYTTAFAVARKNIPVVTEESAEVIGHEVGVAAYAICGSELLADNVVKALGLDKRAVLLANHGIIALGPSMEEALKVAQVAERTAMITLYARIMGPPHALQDKDIAQLNRLYKNYGQKK